jgi:hypothetical protein
MREGGNRHGDDVSSQPSRKEAAPKRGMWGCFKSAAPGSAAVTRAQGMQMQEIAKRGRRLGALVKITRSLL